MLKEFRKKTLVAAAALMLALSGPAGTLCAKNWEPVKSEPVNVKQVAKEGEIEIKTAPGTILIISSKGAQVKVFTILGQLVSDENVPPGMSRFQINAHGVYIIKVGDLTCKVAL